MLHKTPGALKEVNEKSAFSGWEMDILAGHNMVNMYFQIKPFFFSLYKAVPEDRDFFLLYFFSNLCITNE